MEGTGFASSMNFSTAGTHGCLRIAGKKTMIREARLVTADRTPNGAGPTDLAARLLWFEVPGMPPGDLFEFRGCQVVAFRVENERIVSGE